MRETQRPPIPPAQLNLFQPRPDAPVWSNLPRPVRQTVKSQLAALVRQYMERRQQGKESNDDR